MARREEGLLDVLADLPWWVSIVVGVIVYLGVRFAIPALASGNAFSSALAVPISQTAWLAVIFLLPAGFSALREARKTHVSGQQGSARKATTPSRPAPTARACPRCGGELVLRQAKRGDRAGSRFWGCSSYPKCRYTEELAD